MRKIRIENARGICKGTRLIDIDTGAQVRGVSQIDVHYGGEDEFVTADVKLVGVQELTVAHARFWMIDPLSGELKPVKRIEFDDGTTFDRKIGDHSYRS